MSSNTVIIMTTKKIGPSERGPIPGEGKMLTKNQKVKSKGNFPGLLEKAGTDCFFFSFSFPLLFLAVVVVVVPKCC